MIAISRSLLVNDSTQPDLSVDDVWAGLMEKAANLMPYVRSITSCTVINRFNGGLVRDIVHVGQPVRGVVTFYTKRLVHFVRTLGSARGTIDNEIGHDDNGALTLTFTFRMVIDGVEPGSPQEKEFSRGMEADYLDAVQTTLGAVRERVTTGRPFTAPPRTPAPAFHREVFRRVGGFDPAQFAELFASDGKLVFGNGDPMTGPAAVDAGVAGFFATITGLRHRIVDEWHDQGGTVAEQVVTDERLDGKQVTIPAAAICHRGDDGLVDDYRVMFDVAPVYA